MPAFVDAYAVLGMPRSAPQADLKAAHRALVRRHHPDLAPPAEREEATRRVAEINVAYGLVRDPTARRRYDRLLADAEREGRPLPAPQWDRVARSAGRWAGRWWRRNRPVIARAQASAARAYGRVVATATLIAYVWIGTVLAVGLGLLLRADGPWVLLAGAGGGLVVGSSQARHRRSRGAGRLPSRRRSTLLFGLWLGAIAMALVASAR